MEEVHVLLARFNEVWNEALSGNYRNRLEINSISRKLKATNDTNKINIEELSVDEVQSLKFALTIANLKL